MKQSLYEELKEDVRRATNFKELARLDLVGAENAANALRKVYQDRLKNLAAAEQLLSNYKKGLK